MSYHKPFNVFLKQLPFKLNNYYKKSAQSGFKVSNKSKLSKTLILLQILIEDLKSISDRLFTNHFQMTLL
jgi:hypothetical protein